MVRKFYKSFVLLFSAVSAFVGCATSYSQGPNNANVTGNSKLLFGAKWNLVKFSSIDNMILIPDRPDQYSLQFSGDGSVTAQIDCNRGNGTWKLEEPSSLTFGPFRTTRVGCKPSQLERRFGKDLLAIGSFTFKDSKLYLALMNDGGVYEFKRTE